MSKTPSSGHASPTRTTTMATKQQDHVHGHGQGSASRPDNHSIIPFPELKAFTESEIHSTPLSPPLSPPAGTALPCARKKRPEISGRRLKGKSGLRLNESTLRQYTEYDALGGTPRSPFFGPGVWTPNTFGEPGHGDIQSNLERLEEALLQPLPILDVYSLQTVTAVFKDPAAMARLRRFAEPRGHAHDVDFLLQIQEYGQAMGHVASILANVSLRYTGVAASEPVRLPLTVGKSLNAGLRETSNTLMPGLESTFDDARAFLERTLAQDLYPDFVKHQLSLNLQLVGPGYSPNQVCPGFGEAFCLSDPNEEDDPIVFASDGLAGLTGYSTAEIISKNCRLFQGPGTRGSCVDRMRGALARHDEFTELVLNYTKDGRPYWNLVFMARLAGPDDGAVRYHLGGQVDVTEMLEREEEVTHLLGYASPLADRAAAPPPPPPRSPRSPRAEPDPRRSSWRGGLRERRQDRAREREPPRPPGAPATTTGRLLSFHYPPSTSRNRFLQGFRRRHAPSEPPPAAGAGAGANDSGTDLSLSEPPTPAPTPAPAESRRSVAFPVPPSPSSPSPVHGGHFATVSPYSRFMVLEYARPARAPPAAGGPFLHHQDRKAGRAQLPVAFCSSAALASLCRGAHAHAGDVAGRSVFDVLAERAGASVTKSFRSTVRASLAEGRAVKLDVAVAGTHHHMHHHHHHAPHPRVGGGGGYGHHHRGRGFSLTRKRSGVGLSALVGSGGAVESTSSHESALRRTLSLERLVPGHSSSGAGPVENFVSYWTPLKDESGATRWVVVIFVPELG